MKLLKPSDVMEICNISKTAVYELFNARDFPVIILNKHTLRVDEEDLYNYLRSKKAK